MIIEEIHEFVRFLVRKGQGQHYSPSQLDRAIHFATLEIFRHYLPKAGEKQINTAILGDFYTTKTINLTDGKGDPPEDYAYFLDAYLSDDTWVEQIREGDWVKKINDPVEPPEEKYPIWTYNEGKILVRPANFLSIKMKYIRYPVRAKYAYTVSNLDYVFDKNNSVDIEWPGVVHNEIIQKVISNLGFNLKNDQAAIQYEAYKKQMNNG